MNSMKKLILIILALFTLQLSAQYSSVNVTGIKVPKYMVSGNTTRLPVIARLQITNLEPSSLYQYSTRAMNAADLNTNTLFAGAGNALFIDTNSYRYNTSGTVNFTTAATIDSFTTDPGGNFEGWFAFMTTGNATRFKAGNFLYMGITLRGGKINFDTFRLYCQDSIKVLSYSSSNTGDTSCTGLWGKSMASPKSIVATYDNTLGSGRPLSMTYIESDNLTIASMPIFYRDSVNGISRNWGTYMPNTNANGVRRIENLGLKDGNLIYANQDADGKWGVAQKNTVNPTGGITPVSLGLNEAALVSPMVEFWTRTSTVSEGIGTTRAFVVRKYSNDQDQTVRISVGGGTATKGSGADYNLTEPRTITFKPGNQVSDTTSITINDDAVFETDETIVLRLDQASNCVIGTEVAHTMTIKDNDIPNIVLGPNLVVVKENALRVGVKIKIDKATTTQSRIRLFVKRKGDSTLIPTEFKLGNSNTDSTFNLGKSTGADSVTIFSRIFDDFNIDPNDTVVLCVRQLTGPALLTDSLFTLVMTDNDGPSQIRFDAAGTSVNENVGSVKMKIRIVSRSDAGADFSVRLLSSKSTATDGSDFTFGSAKIQSIDNNTPDSIEISVPIINDSDFETLEKGLFVLDNLSNSKILKPDTFTLSIISDDLPMYPISKVNAQTNANKTADSLGVKCRVTGTVHTPNFRNNGLSFMMADKTGGIGVFSATKNYAYLPKEGDSVIVQGRVGQFQGTAQMDNLDTIIFIAGNRALKTAVVVSDMTESTENTMVQVRRVKLVDPAEWPSTALTANGFKYVRIQYTTGGVDTLNIDAETDIDGTPAPAGYLNITGFGQQYDNNSPFTSRYVLTPRKLTDFQAATLPKINFFKKLDTITELADSFKFELQVLPTDENFTFDVKVIGGTATSPLDYDFNGSTITVLKNNSYFAGKANINDDNQSDGPKTLIFGIRNIVGPGSVGADSTLTLLVKDNEASSVRTFAHGSLKMFPNPAQNSVVVAGTDPISSISIADLSGRIVHFELGAGEKQIKLNLNLSAGVYSVQVETNKGVFTDKLILK